MCLLNNPFFILLQCKLYLLIADIFMAATASHFQRHSGAGRKKKSKGKASIFTLLLAMWNGEWGDALYHLKKESEKDFCLKCMLPAPVGPLRQN